MSTTRSSGTAGERHRAQHNSPPERAAGFVSARLRRLARTTTIAAPTPLHALACLLVLAASVGALACAGSLPRPPSAPIDVGDYVPVPFAPRAPPVEFVPPSPAKDAVWVDGSWEWTGDRYVWRFGSWVLPPPGARRAKWVLVRRREDGQLFFAPSSWKDASGAKIDDRPWAYRLGPAARARARLGAAPGAPPPKIETEVEQTPPIGDQDRDEE